jgi:glutathione S-transferase
MTRFTVHSIPGSPFGRTVLLALEEKQADYRLAPMAFGAHRTPEHRALHPFGRIPVLADGDFLLYETQAILRYLDRVLPEPALVPADPRAAARMDQLIGVTDCYVVPQISAPISFPRLIAPRFGLPVDEEAVLAAVPAAENCVAAIAALVGDRPYLAGDALSLADLMLIPHLAYFIQCDEGAAILARHPALTAWIARMDERDSMAVTAPERLMMPAEAA